MLVVPSAALVLAVSLYVVMQERYEALHAWVGHAENIRLTGQQLLDGLLQTEVAARGYAAVPEPELLEVFRKRRALTEKSLRQLIPIPGACPQSSRLAKIDLLVGERLLALTSLVGAAQRGNHADLQRQMEQNRVDLDAAIAVLNDFVHMEDRVIDARANRLDDWAAKQKRVMVGAGILGILGGLLPALLLGLQMVKRLKAAQTNAGHIARGEPVSPPTEGNDEIAELDRCMQAAALQIEERERRLEENRRALEVANAATESNAARLAETVRELEEARQRAETATAAKSDFLAAMSHEIRSPMNAIVGTADLLMETPLDEEQGEYVRILSRAGSNLLILINDILDLSKVEAGQMELQDTDFDLEEVIARMSEIMGPRAHQKGLELTVRIEPDVPAGLRGDPDRLEQVLTNLVSNAIKFTSSGEIGVAVRREDPERPGMLHFTVSDTGIGLAGEKLDCIFERFTQADSSITRKYGGTGLGLAIARRLVELMQGRIWVESQVGQGSVFQFTAQFGAAAAVHDPVPASALRDLRGLRFLVVDDSSTNRLIMRDMLHSLGAGVAEADCGEFALAEIERAYTAGTPYSVLLLDCRMPGMGGFEIAARLKSKPELGNAEIILLTSENRASDIRRSRELGMAAYLVKPVRKSDLLQAIGAALEKPKTAPAESPEPPPASTVGRRVKVLLAEDSPHNSFLVRAYMRGSRYELDCVDNGQLACERFREGGYALVLMDVQMPVMDGYTATRAIREWERQQGLAPVPIVALTAHALKEEPERARAAGCTLHLAKPIHKQTLLKAMDSQLGLVGTPVRRVEIPPEVLELVPEYLESRDQEMAVFAAALEARDFSTVRRLGHNLKGTGAGYGFPELTELGRRLEDGALRADAEEIAEGLAALKACLRRLEAYRTACASNSK